MDGEQVTIAKIGKDIEAITAQIADIKIDMRDIKQNYVSQTQFWAVKTIVYGGAGIMMVGVFTAIVALVLNDK